jgi:hypothetical protein
MTENIADSPLNRKAIKDTTTWIIPKSSVNTPTPMAPIDCRINIKIKTLYSGKARCRKYVPMINNKPRRKTDELKIIDEDPTPRSLI